MSRRIQRVSYHLDTKGIRYIPALEAWEPIDYRKVRARIRSVIRSLRGEDAGPDAIAGPLNRSAHERDEEPQA